MTYDLCRSVERAPVYVHLQCQVMYVVYTCTLASKLLRKSAVTHVLGCKSSHLETATMLIYKDYMTFYGSTILANPTGTHETFTMSHKQTEMGIHCIEEGHERMAESEFSDFQSIARIGPKRVLIWNLSISRGLSRPQSGRAKPRIWAFGEDRSRTKGSD